MKEENKYNLVRIFTKPMRITLLCFCGIFLLILNAIKNQSAVPVPSSIYFGGFMIVISLLAIVLLSTLFDKGSIREDVRKDIIKKHKENYAKKLKNRR